MTLKLSGFCNIGSKKGLYHNESVLFVFGRGSCFDGLYGRNLPGSRC